MPVLDPRSTVRVTLSRFGSDDPAWIEMYAKASVADIEAMGNISSTTEGQQLVALISSMIIDWNLTDPDGSKLPITVESVRRLDAQDFLDIQAVVDTSIRQAHEESKLSPQKKTS